MIVGTSGVGIVVVVVLVVAVVVVVVVEAVVVGKLGTANRGSKATGLKVFRSEFLHGSADLVRMQKMRAKISRLLNISDEVLDITE